MTAAIVESAPAKVNLTLRVVSRRPDGYHELESLVVFADIGDRLSFEPGGALSLALDGPGAGKVGAIDDNLVIRAARALEARVPKLLVGRFALDKRLPVAAGLGGGSSDAAAALRLLARANRLPADAPQLYEAARVTGADVPVCLDPRPRIMRGIGEKLSAPLELPSLPAVLVNPGVAVATKDVFAACKPTGDAAPLDAAVLTGARGIAALIAALRGHPNDLEAPAITLAPAIAEVLQRLSAAGGCLLARMSGSGATCFGLFAEESAAHAARALLRQASPGWWVEACRLGAAT